MKDFMEILAAFCIVLGAMLLFEELTWGMDAMITLPLYGLAGFCIAHFHPNWSKLLPWN